MVFKAANSMRRVVVAEKDVLVPFVVLMTLNFIILLSWTIIDPLVFQRVYSDDELTSYGRCHSEGDSWKGFISALAILNFVAMITANIEAYKARNSKCYSVSFFISCLLFSHLILIPNLFSKYMMSYPRVNGLD